jgi:HK97 family phage prohead protease
METTFKQFAIEAPTFTERKMSFVISTAGVDRDNDTIDPKGWQLTNYMKNPVVMWAHDYAALPVAKATRLEQTDKGLSADIEFPLRGTYPFADTVHDMLKDGFLSATSVGFKPTKADQNHERKGYDFAEQELLEFSIVPVPSNPEALITMRHAGVDDEVVKGWCKTLNTWAAKRERSVAKAYGQILEYIDAQPAWKEFIADYAVETDKGNKPLATDRLVRLLKLHELLPPAEPRGRLHEEDMKAITALVTHKEDGGGKCSMGKECPLGYGKSAKTDDGDDLEIELTQHDDHFIEIDSAAFQRRMAQCVQQTVGAVVADGVQTAMRKLQGKVD